MVLRQAREEAEVQVHHVRTTVRRTTWALSTVRCRACASRWPWCCRTRGCR